MKFGEAKQTLQLPASVISLGVKATRLGLQVLCDMTRQNNISEKGVSDLGLLSQFFSAQELAGQSCTGHLYLFGSLPYLQSN